MANLQSHIFLPALRKLRAEVNRYRVFLPNIMFIHFFCLLYLPSLVQTDASLLPAIRSNDLQKVKTLLTAGADISVADEDGDNALMYAALYSTDTCMRWLLEKGADPNVQNKRGETALSWSTNDLRKTKLLLEYKADPDIKSKEGNTPFLVACVGASQSSIIQLMLEHGADPLVKNKRGETALVRVALFGDTADARLLLNRNVDIGVKGFDGQNALQYAIRAQNFEMAHWLLAHGADPNQHDNYKSNALSYASAVGDLELVKTLIPFSSYTFLINAGGCHSCHGQGIGGVAFALAKEKGFAIQDSILKQALDSIEGNWTQRMHYLAQNSDPAAVLISGGYDLWTFDANGIAPNKTNEMLAKNILHRQRKNGGWVVPSLRPPIEYYPFSGTAMAVRGLLKYLPPALQRDFQPRLQKAKEWMMNTTPYANEEKAFQLLGLKWAGGDIAFINQQAKKLIAAQHSNGGWSQLNTLPPDAYATGQSLYALHQSGQLPVSDPVYQKGISFLLKTQYPDGSWNVQTRSFPTVPYVDSGFPHDKNEFISAAGTNWATMALLLAVAHQ